MMSLHTISTDSFEETKTDGDRIVFDKSIAQKLAELFGTRSHKFGKVISNYITKVVADKGEDGKTQDLFAAPKTREDYLNEAIEKVENAETKDNAKHSLTREDLAKVSAPANVQTTQAEALDALKKLNKKDLVNRETGIVAQVNSNQRTKMISNKASEKSINNGFSREQHFFAASVVDSLWENARLWKEHEDKNGNKEISILRFVSPVIFDGETNYVLLTAKKSDDKTNKVYSVEVENIETLRARGGAALKNVQHHKSRSVEDIITEINDEVKRVNDDEARYSLARDNFRKGLEQEKKENQSVIFFGKPNENGERKFVKRIYSVVPEDYNSIGDFDSFEKAKDEAEIFSSDNDGIEVDVWALFAVGETKGGKVIEDDLEFDAFVNLEDENQTIAKEYFPNDISERPVYTFDIDTAKILEDYNREFKEKISAELRGMFELDNRGNATITNSNGEEFTIKDVENAFSKKYTTIDVVRKKDDEIYYVKLRVADHTHNWRNGRVDVPVVITYNEDPTKTKFYGNAQGSFTFNGGNMDEFAHQIADEVYSKVIEATEDFDRLVKRDEEDFRRFSLSREMDAIKARAVSAGTFMKAPNGKPTKLNEKQWLQVRTNAFKRWFGDWEHLAEVKRVKNIVPTEISSENYTVEDAERDYKNIGVATNKNTGKKAAFVNNSLWKILRHKGFNPVVIKKLKSVFEMSLPIIEGESKRSFYQNNTPHKEQSNIESYDHYINKISIDGKDYYVRYTLQNFKRGKKGTGKTSEFHSSFVSDVVLYESKSGTPSVKSMNSIATEESSAFVDNRLLEWMNVVNENDVSKVIDENGEPLVVYHGTNAEFNVFEYGDIGFHFGTKEAAKSRGETVGEYFLNIKNTLQLEKDPYQFDESGELPQMLERQGIDIDALGEERIDIETLLDEKGIDYGDNPYVDMTNYRTAVKKAGHDGLSYVNSEEDAGSVSYVAFSPSQIKSATDNTGAFDSENADIRYSLADMNVAEAYQANSEVGRVRDEIERVRERVEADGVKYSLIAYHGGNFDFEKPQREFRGKGEGAAAHGAGFYVAMSKDVSKRYAGAGSLIDAKLNGLNRVEFLDKSVAYFMTGQNLTRDAVNEISWMLRDSMWRGIEAGKNLLVVKYSVNQTVSEYENYYGTRSFAARWIEKNKSKFLDYVSGEFSQLKIEGNKKVLHTVSLPDDNGFNYLSEEKPITEEQRAAIEKVFEKTYYQGKEFEGTGISKNALGYSVYTSIAGEILRLERINGNDFSTKYGKEAASDLLRRAGIIGIRYNGRQDGECVVVFDENDVEVVNVERWSLAREQINEKIKNSPTIEIRGDEIKLGNNEKENVKAAKEYFNKLRGEYFNLDSGNKIPLTTKSVKEVLHHETKDTNHLLSVAAMPEIAQKSVYITSKTDENGNGSKYDYYICGLKIGENKFTVKMVVRTNADGSRYYDHRLTKMEKGELADLLGGIKSPLTNNEASPISKIKDKRLVSILQELNDDGDVKRWSLARDGKIAVEEKITDAVLENPQDVILPRMHTGVPELDNRDVLIKKNIFEKNKQHHRDLSNDDSRKILSEALYATSKLFKTKPNEKPNYWILVKNGDKNLLATVDADGNKKNIEVINWYFIREKNLKKTIERAEKEGAHILITDAYRESAVEGEISALHLGSGNSLASESEDVKFSLSDEKKRAALGLYEQIEAHNEFYADEKNYDLVTDAACSGAWWLLRNEADKLPKSAVLRLTQGIGGGEFIAHDIERLSKLVTNIAREMLGKNAKNATKRDVLNAWNEIAKIRLYKKFGQVIAFDDAEALIKADQALKIRRESADRGILPEKIEEREFEALGLEKRIGDLALKNDASDYERKKRH